MEIPIIVEPGVHDGFRASTGGFWGLETEAPTREEAVEKLRELIGYRLEAGAEVFGVEVPSRPHPLARFAGVFRGDPFLESWKDAIAECRREAEERWECQ